MLIQPHFPELWIIRRFFFLLCLVLVLHPYHHHHQQCRAVAFSRNSFPDDFIFGACSSAYQSEGAANEDGRGVSIWDTFTMEYPEKITDHSNGSVADDFYNLYKEDVKQMKDMGLDVFRFSISWPRILPSGRISGGINPKGIQFYNDIINELLANGIKPMVTIFHWDVPQALEDEYGGFLSPNIVDDFRDYADVCFKEFGDRVKYWVTINEPNYFSMLGYATGTDAPGRCSNYIGNCTQGDSATEPYLVVHHQILSHLAAFKLYKQKYQANQMGEIGLTINTKWMVPIDQTPVNLMAASRAFDFYNGWIIQPVTLGHYPETMRLLVGNRLPNFTQQQSEMLKHSFDFLGLNYYTASYVLNDNSSSYSRQSYTTDSHTTLTTEKDGIPIGDPTACTGIFIYPQGLADLLTYMREEYGNPRIIITENGMADWNNYSLPLEDALKDYQRIKYHSLHLLYLNNEIKNGSNVKGYLAWSFMDDFEWAAGYTYRFGLNFVDYTDGLKRYPKYSFAWFKEFLKKMQDDEDHHQEHAKQLHQLHSSA